MPLANLLSLVGKSGKWTVTNQKGGMPLSIPVAIIDARERYGTVDVLIRPVGGDGERWVDKRTVEVQTSPRTDFCRHCGRPIVKRNDVWIDPEASGDDISWRETCDAHDTFTAEHEPE